MRCKNITIRADWEVFHKRWQLFKNKAVFSTKSLVYEAVM
ncbi:hypothetical protein Niako_2190 [Niastella koreensis GR20-10]|uniref:Uncharacterized protein n=1 Tax=Niastella koreensis (strain DSM 17620 / KACC 11465 / NBRC 106392 / GR20-10) TaxID=700598 RepID=G8THV0_NIAKG|nr:hypothetical protein Niako_2190 [Niastella koreensis GR20-10]